MQSLLVKKGYLRANEVDGSFGKITLSGLLGFQFENSLKPDGICDEDDWTKLNS
jgi:peptidoglycan hydrolase-like protein with peptidoglycan-binding domain